jgi:methylenetetrahydrofolate dehydrogenase (NADP+)/methenyltetrahydrofolate cyclohydrolase
MAKAVAADVVTKVRIAAEKLIAETGVVPGIAVVIVGHDPASQVYVASKGKKAKECGFHSVEHALPSDTSEADLVALVQKLNADPKIHGILVQLPLPDHIDAGKIIQTISPTRMSTASISPMSASSAPVSSTPPLCLVRRPARCC